MFRGRSSVVEYKLPKLGVASSSLVARSNLLFAEQAQILFSDFCGLFTDPQGSTYLDFGPRFRAIFPIRGENMAWGSSKKSKENDGLPSLSPAMTKPNGPNKDAPTVIAQGVVMTGKVVAEGDMMIAGKIEGEIHSKQQIIVAETGIIKGLVHCKSAIILGTVEGDIHATDQLTIEETGKLIGDITTNSFNNRPGGFFEGYSHMAKEKPVKDKPAKGGQSGGKTPHKPQDGKKGKEGEDA